MKNFHRNSKVCLFSIICLVLMVKAFCTTITTEYEFVSDGSEDGYVFSDNGTQGTGAVHGRQAYGIIVGDNEINQVCRGFLSFHTGMIPSHATIVSADLIMYYGVSWGDPSFGTTLRVDIKSGDFNNNPALEPADYQAASSADNAVNTSIPSTINQWVTYPINAAGLAAINKNGRTQMRVRMETLTDSDSTRDDIMFDCGNGNRKAYLRITVSEELSNTPSLPPMAYPSCPSGPTGINGNGGLSLPNFTAAKSSDCEISAISSTVLPGETFAASGYSLDGDDIDFTIWTEGMIYSLDPLTNAASKTAATIPQSTASVLYGSAGSTSESMMILWATDTAGKDYAIRVNAPELDWMWPARMPVGSDGTIQVMGKNLFLDSDLIKPKLVVQRGTDTPIELQVFEMTPFYLKAWLPAGYQTGTYKAWVHNGTGGNYGWSKNLEFEVVSAYTTPTNVISVDSQQGSTDQEKLQNAINAAVSANGGIIEFSAGTYTLDGGIDVGSCNGIIILRGAGIGTYNGASDTLSGTYTLLEDQTEAGVDDESMIKLSGAGYRIEDMNFRNNSGHIYKYGVVTLDNKDIEIDNIRLIQKEFCQTPGGGLRVHYDSSAANILIKNSEFFSVSSGITTGQRPTHSPLERYPDYVKITDCTFRGAAAINNYAQAAIMLFGGSTIVQYCDFASIDRGNELMLDRTLLVYWLGKSNVFAFGNTTNNTGPMKDCGPYNCGEQYLFHPLGTNYESIFDTISSSRNDIVVDEDYTTINNMLTEYPNTDWHLFVCAGKGAGQLRKIISCSNDDGKAKITLENDLRVSVQGQTTKVALIRIFKNMCIYNNFIDTDPDGIYGYDVGKTAGVQFNAPTFNSIVADNTFKKLSWGVRVQTLVSLGCGSTGWNLVKDNDFFNLDSQYQYSTMEPVALTNEVWYNYNGAFTYTADYWHSVGNVFRNNYVQNTTRVSLVGLGVGVEAYSSGVYSAGEDKGLILTIMEQNSHANISELPHLIGSISNTTILDADSNDVEEFGDVSEILNTVLIGE